MPETPPRSRTGKSNSCSAIHFRPNRRRKWPEYHVKQLSTEQSRPPYRLKAACSAMTRAEFRSQPGPKMLKTRRNKAAKWTTNAQKRKSVHTADGRAPARALEKRRRAVPDTGPPKSATHKGYPSPGPDSRIRAGLRVADQQKAALVGGCSTWADATRFAAGSHATICQPEFSPVRYWRAWVLAHAHASQGCMLAAQAKLTPDRGKTQQRCDDENEGTASQHDRRGKKARRTRGAPRACKPFVL